MYPKTATALARLEPACSAPSPASTPFGRGVPYRLSLGRRIGNACVRIYRFDAQRTVSLPNAAGRAGTIDEHRTRPDHLGPALRSQPPVQVPRPDCLAVVSLSVRLFGPDFFPWLSKVDLSFCERPNCRSCKSPGDFPLGIVLCPESQTKCPRRLCR